MQIHFAASGGNLDAIRRQLGRGVAIDARDWDGHTPLMRACEAGVDLEVLRFLIDAGADVNAITKSLAYTPLMMASPANVPANVQLLIAAGADVGYVTPAGYNALVGLAHTESPDRLSVIEVLLEAGCDPNQISEYGESVLRNAIRRGNRSIARLLVDHEADREIANLSPLNWAVLLGTLDDVQVEVERGADIEAVDGSNLTPWMMAVVLGDLVKAQWLLGKGSRTDVVGLYDSPPLVFAAEKGDIEMCQWLLSIGCDINQPSGLSTTPLEVAAQAKSADLVAFLLEAGANIRNPEGTDAIVQAGSADVARLLVDAGCDIDAIAPDGSTVLNTATGDNQCDLVKALLDLGADPDNNSTGETALHTAIQFNHLDIANTLLRAGADVNQQDVDGWTPLSFARTLEATRLLLDHSARVDRTDDVGTNSIGRHQDPEMLDCLLEAASDSDIIAAGLSDVIRDAAAEGDAEVVRFALTRGADANAATSWGKTPLMEAAEHHHEDIVRILHRAGADLELTDEDGRTALFHAAAPESLVSFELAMDHYVEWLQSLARLEAQGKSLDTPEIQALRETQPYRYFPSDNTETLECLIELGAELEATDDTGSTALLTACRCGRPVQVAALIRLGANREHRDHNQQTAIDQVGQHHNPYLAEQIRRLLSDERN